MPRKFALKSLLPLAALCLTHCMTEMPREEASQQPVAARRQSEHRFNPSQYTLMAKGDLDGNASKDLFYVRLDGSLMVRCGNKGNTPPFHDNKKSFNLGANAFGNLQTGNYLIGDHNGDGHADWYFIGQGGDLHVMQASLNADHWVLQDRIDIPGANPGDNWTNGKFLAGDVNGDGFTDLYFIYNAGGLALYTNNRAGGFDRHYCYGDGEYGNWSIGKYYVGDFDNDRKSDLFFIGNAGDVYVRLSVDDSHAALHTQLLNAGAFGTQEIGQYHLADIDKDQDADLLFIGNSGDVHIRVNENLNLYTYRKLLNVGQFWHIGLGQYYVGDWNGDGRSDLFFIGNTGYVSVRLSDGIKLPTQLNIFNTGYFGSLDAGNFE